MTRRNAKGEKVAPLAGFTLDELLTGKPPGSDARLEAIEREDRKTTHVRDAVRRIRRRAGGTT